MNEYVANEKFSRQALAFGKEGQEKLSKIKVGIVGVGGIGSQVSQNLAYLGINNFVLIDDDLVEKSNLNRLVGALPDDAKNKKPKVDVAGKVIAGINPEAKIEKYLQNLRYAQVLDALAKTDYLFGCVDNDSARLILSELSSAYEIPLIDSAFEIRVKDHKIIDFGGRVVVACPGDFCLLCANQIDLKTAKIELESPPERVFREKHGYGLDDAVTAPSVISLNTIMAGIAVTEFLVTVVDIRPSYRMITYKGMRGIVTISRDLKKQNCIVCNSLVGLRESADIKRYIQTELPKDLPA